MSDRLDVIRERIDTETYVFNMRSDLEWLLEQGAALTEANKLLEQTIEVLEEFELALGTAESLGQLVAAWSLWRATKGKPLLDNLKALTKEGTE